MVKALNFVAYRKLKSLEINFSPFVNVIAGTNGTCKSSILHLVSNSYQKVKLRQNMLENQMRLKLFPK